MSYNNVRRRGHNQVIGRNKSYLFSGVAPSCFLRFFGVSGVAPASAFRRKVKHHAM
jgi:hypothetical protein